MSTADHCQTVFRQPRSWRGCLRLWPVLRLGLQGFLLAVAVTGRALRSRFGVFAAGFSLLPFSPLCFPPRLTFQAIDIISGGSTSAGSGLT